MDCSLSCCSIHGIFQARALEWVAISFSRGSSWPRDRNRVSHIVGRCYTIWATREVLTGIWIYIYIYIFFFFSIALGDWLKKTLLRFMSKNLLPVFFSRSFMVSYLIYKSLSHFASFLCTVWGCGMWIFLKFRVGSTLPSFYVHGGVSTCHRPTITVTSFQLYCTDALFLAV